MQSTVRSVGIGESRAENVVYMAIDQGKLDLKESSQSDDFEMRSLASVDQQSRVGAAWGW